MRVVEDPEGEQIQTDYVYDTLGNLRETIQGEQHRYFLYDSLNRLIYSKQPEQNVNNEFIKTDPITFNSQWAVRHKHDENGNVIETTDARGVSVTGIYDRYNRIILRDYSDSTPDVSFYYDGTGLGSVPALSKGQITKIKSSLSETRFTSFNNLGKLLTHEQITRGKTYQTAYAYNNAGTLIEETYPSGRKVSNTFDQDGELAAVSGLKPDQTSQKIYLNQIIYNSIGAIEKMRLGNGRWESTAFNNRQQITQIGLGYSNSDTGLLKINFDYGDLIRNNGSLQQQKIKYNGFSGEIVQNYTFDPINRLKSATETVSDQISWKQTFNYDRFGNRVFDVGKTTTISSSAPAKVTNPSVKTTDNRLKEYQDGDGLIDYAYDKSGNITLDAANKRFNYDAENRVKEFFGGSNNTPTPTATYEYDGIGNRIRKISNGVETIFVYNAIGNLVAEYSTEVSTNPKISYLTHDHLGSPRVITDGAGAVVSRHDYMAFGEEITDVLGNVGGRTTLHGYGRQDEIRKQYKGYDRDKESGLDFVWGRFYNYNQGRFITVDPLNESATDEIPRAWNLYSYFYNNPNKFTGLTE